jgi:hypothetical protein
MTVSQEIKYLAQNGQNDKTFSKKWSKSRYRQKYSHLQKNRQNDET